MIIDNSLQPDRRSTYFVDFCACREWVLQCSGAVSHEDFGGLSEQQDAVGTVLVKHEPLRFIVHELL